MTENLVHRDKRGGHAGGGLKEAPPRHPLPLRKGAAQLLQPRLDRALLLGLAHRQVLIARHDLGRHRRRKRRGFRRQQLVQLGIAEKFHVSSPRGCGLRKTPCAWPRSRGDGSATAGLPASFKKPAAADDFAPARWRNATL